ncbi:hypothetical protein FRC07_002960, partial [Ceratobasidium sp. 392]
KWTPDSGYHCAAPLLEVATPPLTPASVSPSSPFSSYHFSQILIRRPYAMIPTIDDAAGKTLYEESRAICLRAARTNAMMLGHYIAINRKPMPWLTPSTRETLVMLVMNGLHLRKSSPSGGEGESEREQEMLLQNCVDILQLMGRVGVHVADMANMLRELATPISTTQSP